MCFWQGKYTANPTNGSTCSTCNAFCSLCTNGTASDCQSCKSGYYLQNSTVCAATCPTQFYPEPTNNTCEPCYYMCKTCLDSTD